MPIVVLFYNDNGLEQYDLMLLQGIYSVAIVVLEIPSGYFADVLGRKKTLIVGSIFGFAGFVVYSLGYGFYGFLIAELILGIGQSLISGADSAMLYDTLLAQNRNDKYLKFEGRMTSVGNFAEAIAGIIGGFLATYSLRTPYFFQTGVAFLAIPAAITLIEPARESHLKKLRFKDIISIFNHTLFINRELRFNIIFSAIIGCSTLTMAWFVQPYFKAVDLPLALYGVLWTFLNLSVGITSLMAQPVEKFFGNRRIFIIILITLSALYILSGLIQQYWAISFLFIFYFIRGFATPILKDYINKCADSSTRATVLSIRNFIIRLLFAAIGPLLGYLTDNYSLKNALTLAGIIFFVSGISLIIYRKVYK